MDGIANGQPWEAVLGRARDLLRARGVHPSACTVLLPYAQLMPVAQRAWVGLEPDGFAARFESSSNWAARLGHAPAADDISHDRGQDLLTARSLLERSGLAGRASLLAAPVVDAAWELANVARAVPPSRRAAWAATLRGPLSAGLDVPALALEAAVGRVALEWAAASAYATDTLFDPSTLDAVGLLVILDGFAPDPLADAFATLLGERAVRWPLLHERPRGAIALHEAVDASDEADRAAACVLAHIAQGRAPVALVAIDRVLTRRIAALLDVRGAAVRDETGWRLSTTRSAARVMALLRACSRDATSDEVLDALKNLRGIAPGPVLGLERLVRRNGLRDWAAVTRAAATREHALVARAQHWRESMARARPLADWLQATRELLQDAGSWDALHEDPAGLKVVEALGLAEDARADWDGLPQAARRMQASEFVAWVDDCLEAASFTPAAPGNEQVVVLPVNQLLGRSFGAVVLPGCDEVRWPACAEPGGSWTPAQRAAIGLPPREALLRERRQGWEHALGFAQVDILWRRGDAGGEALLPGPLVQALLLEHQGTPAPEPRTTVQVEPRPTERPQARAPGLVPSRLSASSYEHLRKCPYRFFALRQLGLQEAEELDADLDKRDFGTWLHQVLGDFHQRIKDDPAPDRRAVLDGCAQDAKAALGLDTGEFLPFAAAWPQVRDGYLAWLAGHEAQGFRFEAAEHELETPLADWVLQGRIDRIDRAPDGAAFVVDYKTEGEKTTTDRVKQPFEDTQLAFYAALLPDDTLRAAYVNVGERGVTRTVEQKEIVEARDALLGGLVDDLRRLSAGAPMQALGEGHACEFCAARGLCRKDAWHG